MPSLLQTTSVWPRLRWSDRRQSSAERGGMALVVLAAAAAWWFGQRLAIFQQLLLWAVLLGVLAYVLRRGWVKLFGPVLFYDMVRTARRRSALHLRIIYTASVAGVFLTIWFSWFLQEHDDLAEMFVTTYAQPSEVAEVNATLLYAFLGLQFAVAFLLTPAYVAGVVSEEKERRTLEYLLATDLRNREIVLGLLIGRLLLLFLILLAGLPILAIMQFLGGIDPDLLLAGFAATTVTVAGLAGLGILNSVYGRRPFVAIVRTYLLALAYLGVTGALCWLLHEYPWVGAWPSTPEWTSPVTLRDALDWASLGNLGVVAYSLAKEMQSGAVLHDILPGYLWQYAGFHLAVFVACTAWAVAKLRSVAVRQAAGPTRRAVEHIRERVPVRVGRWPMIWKEVVIEFHTPGSRLAWLGFGVLVTATLLPAAVILYLFVDHFLELGWAQLGEIMNTWVRAVSTPLACLMLLLVALRAAGTVTTERGRQTFDSLLLTPLESTSILFGKWLGSVLRPRRAFVWLGTIWLIAYLTGGLSLWAMPCLMLAWLVYAVFFAALGLWFSVRSRNTLHAIVGTLVAILLVTVGHWLVAVMYAVLFDLESGPAPVREGLLAFHRYGLTPPLTLDLLTIPAWESRWFDKPMGEDFDQALQMAILGLGLYAVAAGWLLVMVARRFRRLTGRALTARVAARAKEPTSV